MHSPLKVIAAILLCVSYLFGQGTQKEKALNARRAPASRGAQSDAATIVYSRRDGKQITVGFTQEELEEIRKRPEVVLSKLRQYEVTCPEERTRLDECTWSCGDGSKVRTCNTVLNTALASVWK